MLTDFRQHVKHLGHKRIIVARSTSSKHFNRFDVLPFNFETSEYMNLKRKWNDCKLTENFCHVGFIGRRRKQNCTDRVNI